MRKCLTTFGFGWHAEMLRVSLPSHARFCESHGYDLVVWQPQASSRFPQVKGREASWMKVAVASKLLDDYDVVLWLDADVAVLRHDADIVESCDGPPMQMVVHKTPDGMVPNCGVWVLRKPARSFLDSLWSVPDDHKSAWWWEQSAVIRSLGGSTADGSASVPPGPMWGELQYQWNPHPMDARGLPDDMRFFHATAIADRLQAMRTYIQASGQQ